MGTYIRALGCAIALVTVGAADVWAQAARIGVISATSPASSPSLDSFVTAMSDPVHLGGKSVIWGLRYAEGKRDRYVIIAKELVDLPVDVIVTLDSSLARIAANATNVIPIVGAGLDPASERPGENVTGVATGGATEAAIARLNLLAQLVRPLSRLVVLVYSTNPSPPELPRGLVTAANVRKVELVPIPVGKAEDLEAAFAEARRSGAQAMMTMTGAFFSVERQRIARLARSHELPMAGGVPTMAEAGVPLQISPDRAYCAARAANFVRRILRGERAADLPIEHCDKLEAVFNIGAARAIGLTIDSSLTKDARVIEQ